MIPEAAPAPASQARWDRLWIWTALGLQLVGYVVDAAWHGLASPGAEPATRRDMIAHLTTVHALLYIGAVFVLFTILRALAHRASRSSMPATPYALAAGPLVAALAGAVLSVGAEAWHAYSHLRLDTHSAPVAGVLSLVGYLVAVGATIVVGARARRRESDSLTRRRAA
jgi:hypothetical protein